MFPFISAYLTHLLLWMFFNMITVQGRWKLLKTLTQKHILLNMRKFAFAIAITIVKDKDLQKYGNNDNDLTFSNSTKSLDIKFFILFKVFKLFA